MTADAGAGSERQLSRSDKYRVIAELGEGGMAHVFLAVVKGPSGFSKLLVLKAIRPELAIDPEHLQMFLAEARLAARFNHPNVVQTLEVNEHRGRPVIVMEYLEGQAFSNVVHRTGKSMPKTMQLRIVAEALEGLQYIHDLVGTDGRPLELVHRDISPHNIFVTYDGQVKILDFGIAKSLVTNEKTRTDAIKGKLKYMAPEQMLGEGVDRRADLYAMGVILWEIVTGKRVWAGLPEAQIMNKVINEGVPSPRSIDPTIAEPLDALISKALAVSAEARFQSAAEMQAALEDVLDRMGSRVIRKEIGRVLGEMFAEVRADTKRVIDAELERKDSTHPPAATSDRFAFPETLPTLATKRSLSGSGSEARSPAVLSDRPPRRSRALPVTIVVLGVAAIVAIFFALRKDRPTAVDPPIASAPPTASTSASTPPPMVSSFAAAPAPSPTATVTLVTVRASATPPIATLYFDGKKMDGNPSTEVHAVDGKVHAVHAEARGYATQTQQFVLDRAIDLVFPLVATGGALPIATTHPTKPPGPATTATATAPRPDCNPPYYVDDKGIKRLKTECM